jgi:predicted MFS family arabinose efflux permease
MIELVGREDLMNAIALNSSIFNVARIIGPALAGVMMGLLGAAFCFLLNGLSFIAVIIGLVLIKTEPFVRKIDGVKNVFKDIKEGLIYTKQNAGIIFILIVLMIINVFIMNFNVTVPVFVKSVLHQEETVYGLLMSAMGIGSFIGAISVASKSKGAPNRRQLYINSLIAAFMLIPLGLLGNFYLSMAVLAVTGYFTISFTAMANSTVQLNTSDEYRGRIMSLYTMVFAGTTPFGSFIAGSVTDWVGPSTGFILSGGAAIILVVAVLLVKNYRDRKYDTTRVFQG